ncbi:SUMF1/EgtB/PvdO family nonheme iron enzyme [Sorangium sp. So ce269]
MWLWVTAAATCGGCAQLIGADWHQYALAEGAGGAGGTGVCVAGMKQCSANRPQRCNDDGQWEDEARCTPEVPVCSGGECVPPSSCAGIVAKCGPVGSESCCTTVVVPGGSFDRSNDPVHPATVSGFLLDRFEVTVGRYREFVKTTDRLSASPSPPRS